MAQVRSLSLAGKTVNVPHAEHRVSADVKERETNAVTFDEKGFAEVSNIKADALVEFYPRDVERVADKAPASKA